MKCPRCRSEIPDGSLFCRECGIQLSAVGAKGPSRAGAVVLGIVKAVCYVALMIGMQSIVMSSYVTFAMLSDPSLLYSASPEALMEKMMELMLGNITMLTLVSNLLTLLILSLFFTLRRKNPFEEWMLRPVGNMKLVLPLCALWGTALNIFIAVTIGFLPLPQELFDALNNQYEGLFGQTNIVVEILNTAVLTGLIEEIIFRGLSLSRLKRGMSRWWAIGISSVIFGLCHGALIAICYATVLGVIFSLLAERYDSILPTVVCHIFFNLTSYWLTTENTFIVMALYCVSIAVLVPGGYLLFRREKVEAE